MIYKKVNDEDGYYLIILSYKIHGGFMVYWKENNIEQTEK